MNNTEIKQQIIEAIHANHKEQIDNAEKIDTSVADLQKMLPHLNEEEIIAAIAEMNSVKIIDTMPGSLQFFPNLF
jgi:hypothetical protein